MSRAGAMHFPSRQEAPGDSNSFVALDAQGADEGVMFADPTDGQPRNRTVPVLDEQPAIAGFFAVPGEPANEAFTEAHLMDADDNIVRAGGFFQTYGDTELRNQPGQGINHFDFMADFPEGR